MGCVQHMHRIAALAHDSITRGSPIVNRRIDEYPTNLPKKTDIPFPFPLREGQSIKTQISETSPCFVPVFPVY